MEVLPQLPLARRALRTRILRGQEELALLARRGPKVIKAWLTSLRCGSAFRARPTSIQLVKDHPASRALPASLLRGMLRSAMMCQSHEAACRSQEAACHVRTAVTPDGDSPNALAARVTNIRMMVRTVARLALPERMP